MTSTTDIKQKFEGIYYFQDLLTVDECNDIIEYFDKIHSFDAHVQGPALDGEKFYNDSEVNPKTRKGKVKFERGIEKVPHSFKLVSAMETAAGELGIILGDTDDHVDFQLAIYDDIGDHFVMHEDHKMDIASFDMRQRKVSASLQLSNDNEYEGCNLEIRLPIDDNGKFPHLLASRQKGDMVVFPSFAKHKVSKLESGIRNSMVLWYHGPAWR